MQKVTKKHLLHLKRPKQSHKGDFGKILIIGGSQQYVGAVALAGLAALRAGCDWVTIIAPEKVAWAINTLSPDLITEKLAGEYLKPTHVQKVVRLSKEFDVVLIGNGLGTKPVSQQAAKSIIQQAKLPQVIDADAIKAVSPKIVDNVIITPHRKELEKFLSKNLAGWSDKKVILHVQSVIKPKTVVLWKGPTDYIISKTKVFSNTTGNPGMTKAGTGDVLAGLCVGLLAQSNDLLKSAVTAAYVNGLIGDSLLRQRKGEYSFLASDILGDVKKFILR